MAVACLLLAGVMLAALQVRTPAALIATDYGRLLLLKLALVALLLGLGALNRLVLTPALERRAEAASGCAARSVRISRSPPGWSS